MLPQNNERKSKSELDYKDKNNERKSKSELDYKDNKNDIKVVLIKDIETLSEQEAKEIENAKNTSEIVALYIAEENLINKLEKSDKEPVQEPNEEDKLQQLCELNEVLAVFISKISIFSKLEERYKAVCEVSREEDDNKVEIVVKASRLESNSLAIEELDKKKSLEEAYKIYKENVVKILETRTIIQEKGREVKVLKKRLALSRKISEDFQNDRIKLALQKKASLGLGRISLDLQKKER